jgi:leucyl aminopeptidase
MAVTLASRKSRAAHPIHIVTKGDLESAGLNSRVISWARSNGFSGQEGSTLLVPGEDGAVAAALFGAPESGNGFSPLAIGKLARVLPEGDWYVDGTLEQPELAALGLVLGGYAFTRYGKPATRKLSICVPGINTAAVSAKAEAIFLARDLINTPAGDMGPEDLEKAARALARGHKATVTVTKGDALLKRNFPMIHAVGRAAAQAPRLIDMAWGPRTAPKVTLVGKGVCFDTGGLDIKPSSSMLLMKKDMGGAANVLGLASMIMSAGLKIRLRVLIPAVENAISANAFRPGDILKSRKGLTVEIGNTDAEGRLVLADAMALADEEAPEMLIDMATLTGAARTALGPDIAPFYTGQSQLADDIQLAGDSLADPVWRMPLWNGYDRKLDSRVADINNVTSDGFAGSITAALFLQRFVSRARAWAHFDIYGWNPSEKPHCPVGGEAQGIRALFDVLEKRFGT